ncbi:hypothetical protein OG455_20995 [Kitasatospora sp. NBC_01287]|uniref:hypothetical protein n=1 Tax=Kitasatospora sp. NBC_01287 TaxID=2903573 RepID=UPI0022533ADD|nr:hypothetical protein [Kitasatospora sp. NBC_01287]MCX4747961.1 hypothetical protein [Kitasatospora sp. NBC_01287]
MDGQGGFGGHHGGHQHGGGDQGGGFLWVRESYGRDVERPAGTATRSRANSRWPLLLVLVIAAAALLIPLVR